MPRAFSQSIDCFTSALAAIRTHGDAPRHLRAGWELGKVCADVGRSAEASSAYLEAIEVAEALYDTSILLASKEAELADIFGLYQDAAYALSRSGRLRKAVSRT